MAETKSLLDHDLFLIEIVEAGETSYLVTERIITVTPESSAMGVPWSTLLSLFNGKTLRAIPMPGRSTSRRSEVHPGVSTEPGVSTNVELNLVKIDRGN